MIRRGKQGCFPYQPSNSHAHSNYLGFLRSCSYSVRHCRRHSVTHLPLSTTTCFVVVTAIHNRIDELFPEGAYPSHHRDHCFFSKAAAPCLQKLQYLTIK